MQKLFGRLINLILLSALPLFAQYANLDKADPQLYRNSLSINNTTAVGRTIMKFIGKNERDSFGFSVADAGDVNGDGFDDVVIGAYLNDDNGTNAGAAYIYFGGSTMDYTADIILRGESSYDAFGHSVASAGDVNGDGYDDVIVGALDNDDGATDAGKAYIFLGGPAMDNTADISFTGQNASAFFGNSVSSAGDVNSDGYDDVIVGAYHNSDNGTYAGKVYLFYGGTEMDTTADLVIEGETAWDFLGISISSAGDMNGDGYDDIIIGAKSNDEGGTNAGKVYIYFGGAVMDTTADLTITGENNNDNIGASVSSAGDVNGDGYADIIIGSFLNENGRAFIYYGGAYTDNMADVILTGENSSDNFGISVSTAGDINGDGYADVIVGAQKNSDNSYQAGKAYIFYGGKYMDNNPDAVMTGEESGNFFGSCVSTAGDVNGDGYDDVIIGAYNNNEGGMKAGAAYIYMNKLKGNINSAQWTAMGDTPDNWFGWNVSSAGDVNDDGYDDIIISTGQYDNNLSKVYVYFGGPIMDNIADVTLTGENLSDYFGYSASSAGDVNGDGYDDIIVGAKQNGDNGEHAGKVYIFYGGNIMDNVADVILSAEHAYDLFGLSVSSAGDVNGDGYDDVIIGSAWNGSAHAAGKVYIFYGGKLMDSIADVTMAGENEYDYFGRSVSSAGDVNADGFDDVIVGERDADSGAKGKAFIFYGGKLMDNIADVTMAGENTDDWFGISLSSAGDINNDGYDDVIIGTCWNNNRTGKVYIFYGGIFMNNIADIILKGEKEDCNFGISVSDAGDVNNDGYDDVIIGAFYKDDIGKAFILYGKPFLNDVLNPDIVMIGENINDRFGISVSNAGDVNGDGFNDVIIGAPMNDEAGSNAGKAYIYLSTAQSVKPSLYYANDVPFDQGGYISLKWAASAYDTKDIYTITGYIVQRAKKCSGNFAWENLTEIPAVQQRYYAYIAATPYDSISTDAAEFYYRIIAETENRTTVWISNVLHTHSVDNLAPSPPSSLKAVKQEISVCLNWPPNKIAKDFRHYAVYRSVTDGFEIKKDYLLSTTTDTLFIDTNPIAGKINYYKIISLDVHENASVPSPQAFADFSVTNLEDINTLPKKFALKQNYPNPFNPNTIIKYDLPISVNVQIQVYNTLGQRLRTLIDKYQQAGRYSLTFSANNLPSGIYYYKITACSFSEIRKMILIH